MTTPVINDLLLAAIFEALYERFGSRVSVMDVFGEQISICHTDLEITIRYASDNSQTIVMNAIERVGHKATFRPHCRKLTMSASDPDLLSSIFIEAEKALMSQP